MRSLGVIALTLVSLARVVSAQPTPGYTEGGKDRAATLMKDAARAYQSRDYGTALTRFQEAYAAFPSPRILFNLGQAYEQLGRYVEATESFQRFLASDDHAPGRARAEAQRSLEAMRDRVARIEVVSNVAGAEVSIDGQPRGLTPLPRALLVAVGSHQVSVRKTGAEPFDRRIDAVGGTMARVDAQLRLLPAEPVPVAPPPPADPGPPSAAAPAAVPAAAAPAEMLAAAPAEAPAPASSAWRTVGLGLAIAAPVLIGTGVYFGIQARNEAKAIAGRCQTGCAGKDIVAADRAGRRQQTLQWVLIGAGAAALAGGAALFFLGGSPATPAEPAFPVSVGIGVGDGGAAATLAGSF